MEVDLAAVISARNDVDEAIQRYMTAMHGAGMVTNWMLYAEVVDENDDRQLYMGVSANATTWSLRGMCYHGSKLVYALTQ